MRGRVFFRWLAAIVVLVGGARLRAQQPTTDPTESCRKFAQDFYDWYLSNGAAVERAVKTKSVVLSPALAVALKADLAAQARVKGEIVGIDFDPFLNSQDPCERYVVGKVVPGGQGYRAEVYGICESKKHDKPDLSANLTFRDGRWQFENFYYPADDKDTKSSDLLGILRQLRAERQKTAK